MRTFISTSVLFLTATAAFSQTCGTTYTIERGDRLSLMADAVYGDPNAYGRIHESNLKIIGPDPARLEIGMQLFIPCADEIASSQEVVRAGAVMIAPDEASPPEAPPIAAPREVVQAPLRPAETPTLQPVSWSVLVEPDAVAGLQKANAAQVLDIRSAKAQAKGVIPGALSMPYALFRGPADNPGQPPSAEQLSELLGSKGLRLDRPIIIVNSERKAFDTGRAAYIYWILKSLGAEELALMKGGFAGWQEANLPLADTPATAPAYTANLFMDLTWYATRAEVEAIAEGKVRGALLDSRPAAMFRKIGELGLALPSTLPAAQSTPVSNLHVKIGTGTTETEDGLAVLMQLKDSRVNWQSETVVSFCNTGELGALNWFYASELSGIGNVKLYPESTVGWSATGGELVAPNDG